MKLFSTIKDNPLLSFLIFLLILTFGAFVGVLFFESIETYLSKLLGLSNKNETLTFLGISMGGVLVALQALMSYKRAKAMEDTAQAQADAVLKTEQGQRQDRLKNAIEHLGHESDSIRLGGAYELFHLAQDTEELRQTVLDILCAHIRRTTSESEYRKKHKSKPSEEVQSLLTLLFVQEYEIFRGCHINLQESWLNGADLKEARLWKAILTRVHLQKTEFDRAHLQRANFVRAHIEEAFLDEAQLQDTDLQWTLLQGANLKKAQLQGANLSRASLQAVDLQEAHMQGANLTSTRLQGADLRSARLQGVDLTSAKLVGAYLDQVCLAGVGSQSWSTSTPFADHIRMLIGRETDLSRVRVRFGGIEQEDADSLIEGLSDAAIELRERLRPHIGKPQSRQLPEDSGAITGSYTEEEAEQWITEYENAMSEVPADDS